MYRSAALGIVILTVAAGAAAQGARGSASRSGGHPDLEGFWNFNSRVPLQRPATLAGRTLVSEEEARARQEATRKAIDAIGVLAPVEAVGFDWIDSTPRVQDLRSSLISYPESGRLPALVSGVRRMPGLEDLVDFLSNVGSTPPPALASLLAAFGGGRKDGPADFPALTRCLVGADVPLLPQLGDNYLQIIQGPQHVVVITDFDRRVIAVDGVPDAGLTPRRWAGISRGRWEGNTLVVETRDFDGRAPSFAGAGTSHDKVVTERFTRTAPDRIEYAATVRDPKTFQDRIELSFPMARVDGQVYEGACHEGNYSLRHALSAARREDEARQGDVP